MSSYRNRNSAYRDPLRPHRRDDPSTRGGHAGWWVAGGILLVVITLAGALDISYEPIQPPCRPFCSMTMRAG
jgi:hypothetical protein